MRAAEINVGEEVAVTAGTDSFARSALRATKCVVEREPRSGQVAVKLLEDSRYGIGRRKAGEVVTMRTVCLWMPWSTIERRAENERRRQEELDAVEAAREERLAELQRRLDTFAGEEEKTIAWAGQRFITGGGKGGVQAQVEDYVRVPTGALEALLARAER